MFITILLCKNTLGQIQLQLPVQIQFQLRVQIQAELSNEKISRSRRKKALLYPTFTGHGAVGVVEGVMVMMIVEI